MTVRMWRCIVSWSSLSAVYRVPVPGSSRNFLRLKGSVLLRSVKVSLFFSSLSTALICRTSVPGGLSSETFTSYHFSENCGRWLLVSMTRISTCKRKIHFRAYLFLLTPDLNHLPNQENNFLTFLILPSYIQDSHVSEDGYMVESFKIKPVFKVTAEHVLKAGSG